MPRRNHDAAVAQRRERVAYYYTRGLSQCRIGSLLGVTQQQVSLDLVAVRKAWLASSVRDFDAAKAQELAKIDAVEQEGWRGWRRSLRDARRHTVKDGKDGQETADVTEGQAGDPRFLQVVRDCVERRCKILGLDEAQKVKGLGPNGEIVLCLLGSEMRVSDLLTPPAIHANGVQGRPTT